MTMRASLIFALLLAPTASRADVLKCKIDGYNEGIFITTSPDTNQTTVNTPGSASPPVLATELLPFPTAWGLSHSLS